MDRNSENVWECIRSTNQSCDLSKTTVILVQKMFFLISLRVWEWHIRSANDHVTSARTTIILVHHTNFVPFEQSTAFCDDIKHVIWSCWASLVFIKSGNRTWDLVSSANTSIKFLRQNCGFLAIVSLKVLFQT